MNWIKEGNRPWRIVFLGLLIVGLSGPWGYDLIHVPFEYPCSEPWVRLEEDFCGLPVSPISFLGDMVVQPLKGLIGGSAPSEGGTALGDVLQILLLSTLPFLPMLPILSTAILILRGDHRGWRRLHRVGLGLAGGYGVLFVFVSYMTRPGLAIWGVWMYTGLVALMLFFEASWAGRGSGE
jgi:hypothetical protein